MTKGLRDADEPVTLARVVRECQTHGLRRPNSRGVVSGSTLGQNKPTSVSLTLLGAKFLRSQANPHGDR
jgi:hypothetical protein